MLMRGRGRGGAGAGGCEVPMNHTFAIRGIVHFGCYQLDQQPCAYHMPKMLQVSSSYLQYSLVSTEVSTLAG